MGTTDLGPKSSLEPKMCGFFNPILENVESFFFSRKRTFDN